MLKGGKLMNTALPFPDHPALTWRPLSPDDVPALAALEAAGLAVDGGLPLASSDLDFVRGRYALDAAAGETASIGAWRPHPVCIPAGGRRGRAAPSSDGACGGSLAAATAVRLRAGDAGCRAVVAGLVHPDARRQRLGDFLMRWALAQAAALLAACPAGGARVIVVGAESHNPIAGTLYARYGLRQTFAEYVMRRDLDQPLPAAPFPAGVEQVSWSAESAPLFFEAYHAAFRERPGFPGLSAEEWIGGVNDGNDDLNAERTRVVLAAGRPVAFVINALVANTIGWVVQIGVRPEWRGRGIAQALLVQLMRELQADGVPAAWLTVHENNPRAFHVYQQLGFVIAGRRTRYTREEVKG
jgi:mycothiol synthase